MAGAVSSSVKHLKICPLIFFFLRCIWLIHCADCNDYSHGRVVRVYEIRNPVQVNIVLSAVPLVSPPVLRSLRLI